MGEAARRKKRELAWRNALDAEEQIVVRVAERLSPVIPPFGACYQATFFLRYHLSTAFGINGDAVVGFVNDGTDHLFSSHAWFTFRGQMTDLAISRPLRPQVQRPGPVTIQGYELKPGWKWTYHLTEPPEGSVAVEALRADQRYRAFIEDEESLRRRMVARSTDLNAIREYLDGADNGLTYEALARAVA